MFNALRCVKMLEDVGFSREQAETSIRILIETMEDTLATKQDMKDLATSTSQGMTIRMGTMLAASIAILTAIQKLI